MGGGGSSGGGGGTTQSVSNAYSSLSPWIAPYVTSMLGAGQNQVFQTQNVAAVPAQYDSNGNLVPGTGTSGGQQITGLNPYTQYGLNGAGMTAGDMAAANASVANFSPLQQQSFQGAANLQVPGQFNAATNFANQAGYGGLNTTNQAGYYGNMGNLAGQNAANASQIYGNQGAQTGQQYGGLSAMQGQQGANIGASLGQMSTNPGAVGAYMNPYIQNAINPALQTLNQQYGIAGTQMAGQATGAGAFGGSRNALQQNLNAQNQMLAQNQLVGGAYQNAYQNAQQQMNAANQAALAGNQQALTGYGQAGSQALQGLGMGLQGANQAGNLGIAGAQAGLQGVGAQQAGYNLAGQQASNLANIGSQQLAAQQGVLGTQNTYGQQQTAQQQAIINQAMQNYQTGQQYPWTQLTNLKNLVSGVPVTDTTQTQQTAAPSTANLIGGAGLTALGTSLTNPTPSVVVNNPSSNSNNASAGKSGGIVNSGKIKKMNSGGISSIYRKALNDPASVPDQSIKDGTIQGLPAQLVQAMKLNEQQQAQAPQQAPTSTVIQDVDTKAAQQQAQEQQIDEQKLLAQLPTIMADLKVKRDIAEEKGDKKAIKSIDTQISEISMLAQRAQEKMQLQPQQAQGPQSAPPPQGIDAAMAQQQQAQAMQQPQQVAQAPQSQGIAAFNKGGVARYATEPSVTKDNTPQSGWGSDPNYDPDKQGLPTRFGDIGTYWSKKIAPNLSSLTANMQPATPVAATPTPADNKPVETKPARDYSGIEVHGNNTGGNKTTTNAEQDLNIPQYDVKGTTNDVTKMISNWSDMLMKQYNQDTSMQDLGAGLRAAGGAWASGVGNQGLGNAINAFGSAYSKSAESSQERKDKQLQQLMSLGLSGAQLKMEAAKLGISERDITQKAPLIAAQVNWYNAKAAHPNASQGLGSVQSATANKVYDTYAGYAANPSPNDPVWAYVSKSKDAGILQGLKSAKPGTPSYDNAKLIYGQYADALAEQRLNKLAVHGAKTPIIAGSAAEE